MSKDAPNKVEALNWVESHPELINLKGHLLAELTYDPDRL